MCIEKLESMPSDHSLWVNRCGIFPHPIISTTLALLYFNGFPDPFPKGQNPKGGFGRFNPGMERDVMPSHRALPSKLIAVCVALSIGTERRTPSSTEAGDFDEKMFMSLVMQSSFMTVGSDKLRRPEMGSSGAGM